MARIELDYFIQYERAAKFRAWLNDLQVFANQYNMEDIEVVYDLDQATGYQLDYIGKLVGFPRPVNFVNNAMTWRQGFWRNNNWGGSGSTNLVFLDDDSYRKILKVYCSQLNAPITLNNIYRVLFNAFGDYDFEVIAGGMEIRIRIPADLPAVDKNILIAGIIVPPQGVNIVYEIIP